MSRKAEVLNHWIAFAEGFSLPSASFYDGVERELAALQIPGLSLARVDFSEGGMLSNKRTYLRMLRERLVFDVCACPFGTGYFFSCRTAEIPAVVRPWEILLLLFSMFFLLYQSILRIGFFLGPFVLFCFLVAGVYVMRNAVALGLRDLDLVLLRAPVLGAVYEAWIRKETYYREDSRLMYLEVVPALVKSLAEKETGAKGILLVRQYEQAPVLGELYRRRAAGPLPSVLSEAPTATPNPN